MSVFKGLKSAFHSYVVELPVTAAEVTPVLALISSAITPTSQHPHHSPVSAPFLLQLHWLSHLGSKYTSSSAFLVLLVLCREQFCSPSLMAKRPSSLTSSKRPCAKGHVAAAGNVSVFQQF